MPERGKTRIKPWVLILSTAALCMILASCAGINPLPDPSGQEGGGFTTLPAYRDVNYTPASLVQKLSEGIDESYLIGPGDVLALKVWKRPEVSDPEIIVGPDGAITVERIGNIRAGGRTRESVAGEIKNKLSRLYHDPEVTLIVRKYTNNRAFVLGRIERPGVVHFPGKGTLLEALSLAGGLPAKHRGFSLNRCAIIRGKDLVIWIDLRELLNNGNMALNARIQNNDVIFIPEDQDEIVYVMGEVQHPGAVRIKTRLSYLEALMMSGGPTKNANLKKTYLLRFDGDRRWVKEIDLDAMLNKGDLRSNYQLQGNDVVYVAERGISRFNYALQQYLPALQVLSLSTSVLENFGVMQEFRRKAFGQKGFVNP
ncbi:MAG: polysaccharide biosynthesis/export family protein [Deltaproteobacteria bacterium]|nr:polysaccharide biosynthesis/export family protein [Deltaproteobacteria bacterium]